MLTLQLFGGCALVSDGEAITGPAAQRRRLAVLALLAASGTSGVSRDKLVAYFWPEEDRERARHFLSDSVFTLRKALGKEVLLTPGDDIRLNFDVVDADVATFDTLVAGGELESAVALYRGPFLDGFFVSEAAEFERWAEAERDRLAQRYAWCLEQLAERSESDGGWLRAAAWWRRLATHDPYNSRVALRTMRALDAAGDAAGALNHARRHDTRVREELGLHSNPAVVALADELRTRSTTLSVARSLPPIGEGSLRPERPASLGGGADPTTVTTKRSWPHLTSRRAIIALALVALASTTIIAVRTAGVREIAAGPAFTRTTGVASPGAIREGAIGSRTRRDEARELYTQGRYTLTKGQFDASIHRRALDLFNQAAERDPSFAPAYAGMADVYNHSDDYLRAKQAALRALELDSSLAEAHTAHAYVLAFYEHRWDAADSALRRAIALNPRYVLAYLRRANVLAAQARYDEALGEVERAREIQPEAFIVLLNRGMMAGLAGRPDEAIAHFQAALVLEPGRKDAQEMLASAYWEQGRYAEAQGLMRSTGNVAGVAAMSGDPDTMARLATSFAASSVSYSIDKAAALYARLGRTTEAFEQLERLYQRRDKFLALRLRQQPLVSLRDDPRYVRLLAKLGLR